MGYFNKDNVFLDGLISCIFLCGALLIISLSLLLFGTRSTDFSCIRSSGKTECNLIREALLFKTGVIKIHNPIEVNVYETPRIDSFGRAKYYSSSGDVVFAKISSKNVPSKIEVYRGYDHQFARDITKEINEFLRSSNVLSFHKRF
jgi:hypothetical protein